MIFDLILKIFYYVINGLLYIMPIGDPLPTQIADGLDAFQDYFKQINFFFPLDTLFQLLILFFTIETGILLFKFFNFIIKKLRGSG